MRCTLGLLDGIGRDGAVLSRDVPCGFVLVMLDWNTQEARVKLFTVSFAVV